MQCMKCGREIPAGSVFCEICLEDMAKYPVKPGTAVTLPKREPKRPPERRQKITPEEQILQLKKRNRILCGALALALALVMLMGALWLWLPRESVEGVAVGQNYSSGQTTGQTE